MQPAQAQPSRLESESLYAASAKDAELHGSATTALQDGQLRTLKKDDTFAIFNHSGDAIAARGSPEGIYNRDTRYLSHFCLAIENAQPKLLSSTISDDNATLTCDLTNPDLFDPEDRLLLAQGLLHFRRSRLLSRSGLLERLAVTNFSDRSLNFRIEIAFGADYADLFEVRGAKRAHRGRDHAPKLAADRVTLGYTGLDRQTRQTTLGFYPVPRRLTGTAATFELDLAAHATSLVFIEIACGPELGKHPLPDGFFFALRDGKRMLRRRTGRGAAITTSNDVFNETLHRSVADLYMLVTSLPSGPYPYAGIPWFSTVFGRDALITAWQTLWFDPSIARGVLRHLADNQATEEDAAADAEPGKILHEARGGEMAALGEVPFRRYYGSVDSTPLFLLLAGAYLQRTADLDFVRRLQPHLDAACIWLDRYGDRDGDGFVEYGRRSADGLANQGWKDSHDSIFHADGTLARGSIALAEVQAYVYGARRAMAEIYGQLGAPDRAAEQAARGDELQRRFDDEFFDRELGTYVLALDGDKRPCRVRSSNAGHVLFAGLAYRERAASVVRTLMNRTSFSGWGVRTIATTEARYNPMSYHNGSVWPHDNAIIAAGFARYGFRREAALIIEGLFAASTYFDLQRLPELFCGFARQHGRSPTFYPVACVPQAWAAATPLSLLQSCLGLTFDQAAAQVLFDQPVLPDFVDDVTLRRLSVGSRSIDATIGRREGRIVTSTI
ncbi:MAG: amylo-alpha-1,6-glucosidase [Proteobacteria bacterium]|nr:amylo-alpha-1,6-glucosidase [Pseudomonadota bacterium]